MVKEILELMKTIQEFIFENDHVKGVHGIFEMSQISDKVDQLPENTSVLVYGEKDDQGTKPPHFHIKIDKDRFEFEVTFDHLHDLEIWRSKTVKHDWDGYKNVKKAIKKWFDQPNSEEPEKTNIEVIFNEWNRQNPDHKIDKKYWYELYKKLK